MIFQTPDTFYLVAVDFTDLGFGSGGDITPEWDDAVDQYGEMIADGDRARVFRIEMDARNMPAAIMDVTGDANDEITRRLRSRGYGSDEIFDILEGAA